MQYSNQPMMSMPMHGMQQTQNTQQTMGINPGMQQMQPQQMQNQQIQSQIQNQQMQSQIQNQQLQNQQIQNQQIQNQQMQSQMQQQFMGRSRDLSYSSLEAPGPAPFSYDTTNMPTDEKRYWDKVRMNKYVTN